MDLEQAARYARLDATPQELREKIADGTYQLLRSDELVVLWTIYYDYTAAERYLWIHLAYGDGRGLARRYTPQLLEIARHCGCHWLAFGTRRPGWRRLLWSPWREMAEGGFAHPVPGSPAIEVSTLSPGQVLYGV